MPRHCDDSHLFYVVVLKVLSDLPSRFVPIHVWHVAVHQNQIVIAFFVLVLLAVVNNFVKSLLSVENAVTNLSTALNFYRVLQNNKHCVKVEILVIDNEDPTLGKNTLRIKHLERTFLPCWRWDLGLICLFLNLVEASLRLRHWRYNILKLEGKWESRAFILLWIKKNLAAKLLNNKFWNH